MIGTNLRAGRVTRGARFKQHVVEFSEGSGAANRLVPSRRNSSPLVGVDQEDDIADVWYYFTLTNTYNMKQPKQISQKFCTTTQFF